MVKVCGYLFFLLAMASWPASAELHVTDDMGNTLSLEQPAQRIISLAPNITEMLFFVDAGDQIVGADEYSNYPQEARKIIRVNNYAAANYELILALKPDVVVAWQSGNGEEIIRRLRALHIPVFVVEPRSLDAIGNIFTRFGEITGHQEKAAEKAAEFQQQLNSLRDRYSGLSPVSVFYQIWHQPLITLNGEHVVSDVIRLCGGQNVFADAAPLVPYVNIESVLRANPDVIVASGSSEDSPQWLELWQDWPSLSAVQNGHVYFIPPDLMQRHSMRILEGATRLCELLDRSR
jgi:iron complex transport system substrate-binding protein